MADGANVMVPVRVSVADRESIRHLAARHGTGVSTFVRTVIRDYLEREEREGGSNALPDGKGESVRQVWTASTHALQ